MGFVYENRNRGGKKNPVLKNNDELKKKEKHKKTSLIIIWFTNELYFCIKIS